ncbi:hypothetical protein [Streptomyces sp. NPDC050416]|uniref:hypothetical protein n=1 Tax=Streptomyces sp. NPDC050416 TaxID=3365611 RepID=UPI003787470F
MPARLSFLAALALRSGRSGWSGFSLRSGRSGLAVGTICARRSVSSGLPRRAGLSRLAVFAGCPWLAWGAGRAWPPWFAGGSRVTRHTWLSRVALWSAHGLAGLATGPWRPGHGALSESFHLVGQGVPGFVGGAQVVRQLLHGDDNPSQHGERKHRCEHKSDVGASAGLRR